jgi:CRISPR-associated exonuclease Cas4
MLSVSMLCSYDYCKRKLFLNYVLGFREPFKKSTSLGTIRHETYDNLNKIEELLIKSIKERKTKEELIVLYKSKYREILTNVINHNKKPLNELSLNPNEVFKQVWPLILEEAETRATILYDFIILNNIYGEELWDKITPKIKSEIRIESEELHLKGIIDQLEIYPQGIVPIDLKTGSMPKEGVWPSHKIQIAAYAMLAEEKYKKQIKEGFIHYLDHKEKRHIPINIFLKDEIKELVKKVENILSNKELPDIVDNQNKCTNCGLKEICGNEKELKKSIDSIKTN